jgi:hypothetical protein
VVTDLVDACADVGVRTSQAEGIGRIVALTGMCAWNNLGRNVVFADERFRPLAIVDETYFPDDDERAQYDLDIHAILEIPGRDLVLALNHLGLVRTFRISDIRRPDPPRQLRPDATLSFVDDVERAVVVGDRLVGSGQRSQRASGLLVSEPLLGRADGDHLAVDVQGERWGEVTALATWPERGNSIVVGGGDRVSLAPMVDGVVGPPRWEAEVGFQPAVLQCADGLVWAAGGECGATDIDDYDWEQVRGGGFAGLDPDDGRVVVVGRFTANLAWGNGGVAVVMAAGMLCGIGRAGELALFDAGTGESIAMTAPVASRSLGIAHGAAVGDHLLVGWNRDGYRLHACAVSAMTNTQTR